MKTKNHIALIIAALALLPACSKGTATTAAPSPEEAVKVAASQAKTATEAASAAQKHLAETRKMAADSAAKVAADMEKRAQEAREAAAAAAKVAE